MLLPALPNLPALLPSQTLYSWCGAVHCWNGNANPRTTSMQLFGVPRAALRHDFPSHLVELKRRTGSLLPDIETLALRHTMLGYFLAGAPTPTAEAILRDVQRGSLSHVKMTLGLPASRVGANHPLKGCPLCFDRDEASSGAPFWRIEHQYPSTFVCTEHGHPLDVVEAPTTPAHRLGWFLPRHGLRKNVRQLAIRDEDLPLLNRLAEASSGWSELRPSALDRQRLSACYQTELSLRGLATPSSRLRLPRLAELMRASYSGLSDLPGLQMIRSLDHAAAGSAATVTRASPRPAHPLKHLLVIAALFDSWSAFLRAYAAAGRDLGPTDNEPAADLKEDDRMHRFVELTREAGLSVSSAARAVGVSTATGVRWATINGIEFTRRTKTLTNTTLNEARRLLVAGKEKAEIQAEAGISLVSLNRLITSEAPLADAWRRARLEGVRAEKRAHFSALLALHRGQPLKAIRSVPGNGFSWLHRNDREWLQQNIPSLWNEAA